MKKNTFQYYILLALFTFCFTTAYSQTVRYVKPVSSGTGDGSSWLNASGDLQDIINTSSSGDEIWVAAGTYVPIRNANDVTSIDPNNYDDAFVLKDGVKIYGSFIGNETALSQRVLPEYSDTVTYSSILSGDFNGDDTITANGEFLEITNNIENANHVIIAVGSEESPLSSLTILDGFTIKGGYAYIRQYAACTVNGQTVMNDLGGGLHNLYSEATYSNITFIANSADSGGAGMFNSYSSSVFTNIIAKGNTSKVSGGGIHNSSSITAINNIIIKGNKAIEGSGGGIFNVSIYDDITSELSLIDVIVNNNISGQYGGGICNSSANFTLTNGEVNNNTVQPPYSNIYTCFGGGIFNSSGIVTITDATINNNYSRGNGGGIYSYYDDTEITLNNVTVDGNSVDYGAGAGIMNRINATLILNNCYITNNNANINSSVAGINSIEGSSVICTNTVISGNNDGGFMNSYSSADFTDVIITENIGYGITNNGMSATGTYTNVVVSYNTRYGASNSHCSPVYTNVTFEGNGSSSSSNGGGVINTSSSATFTDVTIINNTTSGKGGGVYNISNSETVFINSIMNNNTSGTDGGGIYTDESNLLLINCELKSNSATSGGAMYLELSESTITNTVISGNIASYKGGGIYNEGTSPILTNVTITGNQGAGIYSTDGGIWGVDAENSYPELRNCIVWGNSIDIYTGASSSLTSTYSLIGGVTTTDANGNIDGSIDPLFIEYVTESSAPTADGNYTLASNSPLINIGNNMYFSEGQTPDLSNITTDLAGNTRIQEATVDLGAYEYNVCNVETPTGNPIQEITITEGETPTINDLEINGSNIFWYASLEDIENNIILSPETELINNTTYYAVETTGDCQSEPFAVTVSITLSINNFNKQNLRYYPNPVTDRLYLENDTTIGIVTVYNLPGKKVMEVNLSESTGNIDLSLLQSGTYIVKLISETNNSYFLIIKS